MSARPKVPLIARSLLGLAFVVFGLNFFLHFIPQPPIAPEAGAYLGALVTGKILLMIKVIEVTAGLLLLTNRFVPLALTLLAPVEVGILAFHGVFEPASILIPVILAVLSVYLAWAYRAAFAPMLRAHVEPTPAGAIAGARQPVTA
jgi:uncharacterized membrane protein YphA (DoxX/SURF4 family)